MKMKVNLKTKKKELVRNMAKKASKRKKRLKENL